MSSRLAVNYNNYKLPITWIYWEALLPSNLMFNLHRDKLTMAQECKNQNRS